MKIADVDAVPIAVPMIRPLKMAVAHVTQRECLIVRIVTDDGVVGWGEAVMPPYFTGESAAGAKYLVDKYLQPELVGEDPFDLRRLAYKMERVVYGNHGVKGAINIALYDLLGRSLGIPVYALLGGKVRDRVEATWHVSYPDPDDAADEAREGIEQGFRIIKLKVGSQALEEDMRRVEAVRDVLPDRVKYRLDANQGWSVAQAVSFCQRCEPLGVELVEQPVARWDLAGMAEVTHSLAMAVVADEGVAGSKDTVDYVRQRAADGVVIKLIKAGGVSDALHMASVADAANLGVHLAGFPGTTSLAAAAELHLAAALDRLVYDTGIAPHFAGEDIVTQPILPRDGGFAIPQGPGLGVEVVQEAVKALQLREAA